MRVTKRLEKILKVSLEKPSKFEARPRALFSRILIYSKEELEDS